MANQNWGSGHAWKEQLCDLYAEVERTKELNRELLSAIWTDRLGGIRVKASDPIVLAGQADSSSAGTLE